MVFMIWFSPIDEFMRQNVHLVGKYIVMVSCYIINQSNLKLASVHLRWLRSSRRLGACGPQTPGLLLFSLKRGWQVCIGYTRQRVLGVYIWPLSTILLMKFGGVFFFFVICFLHTYTLQIRIA